MILFSLFLFDVLRFCLTELRSPSCCRFSFLVHQQHTIISYSRIFAAPLNIRHLSQGDSLYIYRTELHHYIYERVSALYKPLFYTCWDISFSLLPTPYYVASHDKKPRGVSTYITVNTETRLIFFHWSTWVLGPVSFQPGILHGLWLSSRSVGEKVQQCY